MLASSWRHNRLWQRVHRYRALPALFRQSADVAPVSTASAAVLRAETPLPAAPVQAALLPALSPRLPVGKLIDQVSWTGQPAAAPPLFDIQERDVPSLGALDVPAECGETEDADWRRLETISQRHRERRSVASVQRKEEPDKGSESSVPEPSLNKGPLDAAKGAGNVPQPGKLSGSADKPGEAAQPTDGQGDAGDAGVDASPSGQQPGLDDDAGGAGTPATAGDMTIGGDAVLGGGAAIGGSLTAGGNIIAGGEVTAGGSVNAGGSVAAGGGITTGGGVTSGTEVSVGSNVTAGSGVTAGSDVSAGQSVTAGGQVTGDAAVTAGQDVTAGGGVQSGAAAAAGESISAGSDVSATALLAKESVSAGGNVLTGAVLKSEGAVTAGGSIMSGGLTKVEGALIAGGDVDSGGATTVKGTLISGANVSSAASLKTSGSTVVGGDLQAAGTASLQGATSAGGDVSTGGAAKVSGSLQAGGSASVGGSAAVAGSAVVGQNLQVAGSAVVGSAVVGGDVNVGGSATGLPAGGGAVQRQVDESARRPPLQEVWEVEQRPVTSVQRQIAMEPFTPPTAEHAMPDGEAVRAALAGVQTGQPSRSGIQLVMPHGPRPVVQRAREPIAPAPRRAQEPALAEEARPIITTEIGTLPADLWELIGRTPPAAAEAQPAALRVPAIQRAPAVEAPQPAVAVAPPPEAAGAESSTEGPEVDVDELARQVHAQLRRRLLVEWERLRGRRE